MGFLAFGVLCVYVCLVCLLFRLFGFYLFVWFSPPITNSDQGNSPPVNSEILQKKHDDQIIYVCLIEKFYPEVIRVEWTDGENKKVTDNMVNGDPWKHPKEDKYSISSWLTVPAETKDKNYYCKYQHESQERSLSTAGIYTPHAKNGSMCYYRYSFFLCNRITETVLYPCCS